MKRILLWYHSVKSSIFSLFVLFLAMVMVLFLFSNAIAEYRYEAIGYERFSAAFEGKGLFFTDVSSATTDGNYTIEDVEQRLEVIESLRQNPSVAEIYTETHVNAILEDDEDGYGVMVRCYSPAMLELFPELSRGQWFQEPVNSDGSINIIVCGSDYWDVPIGTEIKAEVSEKKVVFRVCGVLYSPEMIPMFGGYSSNMYLDMFYKEGPHFVISECEETMDLVLSDPSTAFSGTAYNNFLIEFEKNAREEDINSVMDSLKKLGGCQEMSDILDYSGMLLRKTFLSSMMTPLFLLGISFIAYFSISILSVQKRLYSYSVYYLLGYSKARMVWSTVCHIGIALIPAVLLNVWYTLSYRTWVMRGIMEIGKTDAELYFDSFSPWFAVGAAVFLFLITLVACLGVLRKKSPTDVWRRSKE